VPGQHLNVDLFAALERHRQARIVVAVEQLERRRFNRRNQISTPPGRQLPQRRRALLLHVGMRRKIFKGKHIVRREPHHARRIDGAGQLASGLEQRLQRLGGLVVGHDHDHRLLGRPRHQRQVERAPSPSARTHAAAPHPGSGACERAQIPGVLQLRKNLADKRENHQFQFTRAPWQTHKRNPATSNKNPRQPLVLAVRAHIVTFQRNGRVAVAGNSRLSESRWNRWRRFPCTGVTGTVPGQMVRA
jgi:hypothetical protein